MRAEWKDTEGLDSISKEIALLRNATDDKQLRQVLNEIGKYVKGVVRKYAPKASDKRQTHIIDDITYKVGKTKTSKELYVSIKGGKDTGWRWVFVNNGFTDRGGNFHEGNHFVDKAEADSEKGVEEIINRYLKDILKENNNG